MLNIFKNPVTIWLKLYLESWIIKFSNRDKHIEIGYMSNVKNCLLGKHSVIYDNVIMRNCSLGDYSYVSSNCVFQNTIIGKFCSIGPNVRAGLGNHLNNNFVSTHPAFFVNDKLCKPVISFVDKTYHQFLKPITIGNDVWIGANAIILDGISIGDGAIVGAGAVVNKDVPPYAIVAGVPARIIRYRFNPEQVERLLKLRWWDKDVQWLKKNADKFLNIDQFITSQEPAK
ncbi:CatB-related O-acetyltransferase [Sporolituus thermophilus]|uniref:Acetyltransferase (Isoleucine patch superfamily) n=1 Tax=Sporolituus thermophilus DSM 23256 TaxID=1123285 RepID=A0A1G7NCN7_9FIRM|nr:CatB-related O-acetyltransferase [Sporolituus thermophilus]SDF71732.1 Acetyltransferase (isoleucine patch superfamily) [Sporolituus thermophilus DSM 23256]